MDERAAYVPSLLRLGEVIRAPLIDTVFWGQRNPSLVPTPRLPAEARGAPFLSALRRCQFHQAGRLRFLLPAAFEV